MLWQAKGRALRALSSSRRSPHAANFRLPSRSQRDQAHRSGWPGLCPGHDTEPVVRLSAKVSLAREATRSNGFDRKTPLMPHRNAAANAAKIQRDRIDRVSIHAAPHHDRQRARSSLGHPREEMRASFVFTCQKTPAAHAAGQANLINSIHGTESEHKVDKSPHLAPASANVT